MLHITSCLKFKTNLQYFNVPFSFKFDENHHWHFGAIIVIVPL